jgi:enamine deaminase RidA (YjgF/YER057c/UK114 family)
MSYEILNPEALGAPRGYNNGLLAPARGRILFVAGQVAMDADGHVIDGDVAAQWARALENVLAVVRAAGGGATHIGRMTIFVTDRGEYMAARSALGAVWRRVMGSHYPAMTLVEVKGLVEDGAVVEIEATAVIPE